jgi:GNAT superfamily N-acetyltransferase
MSHSLESIARESEVILFGSAQSAAQAVGKALLIKALPTLPPQPISGSVLREIVSESDWTHYTNERAVVEAAYGIAQPRVTDMVNQMRARSRAIPIAWYFFHIESNLVGAVGLLQLQFEQLRAGRLQDVDVFPRFRGLGYGNRLLAAIETLAATSGNTHLVIGADQDDWPLRWYLRNGYEEVTTVAKQR